MAEKKKITRVISKAKTAAEPKVAVAPVEVKESIEQLRDGETRPAVGDRTIVGTKKGCSFCQSKTIPTYIDIASLRRYLTDRSKIVPKMRSGVCSKHQRAVSKNIKYARHLALLPFVPKV